ncbi:MAG: hypothetical protein A2904_02175 [Candidatus Staskawiczbacteria bacterium RIFCSPLOWO2_01_FULL_33_9]|uniref:Aminoacyl-transfer RNA synthetases class-II family profile domain-containing protein n=1 Tax=Candidatus Staskawiczbacteria bacterium RIFCSPLOWO2_01_FULL_33_9 TaxID=1802211 RepID=A0A1G2I8Y8_9BACT|nr:MAG: hypothetical protein A2904_02175 [Candidatus Staskawiczbacteria bacterium RIFCSPLOWO2_01_FULL_33_9]
MRLSKQLFVQNMRRPIDYSNRRTSSLLEEGIFTYFRNPGVPFYLPHGRQVLTKLQNLFLEESRRLGISHIEVPAIMRDEVLKEGEEITETFNERIIRLNNESLKRYHLLTTPEPMIIDLASVSLNTFNQLPIRFVYNVEVIRGIKKPKGILKGRQFKVFMGNSLDEDEKSLEESLGLFEQFSDDIFCRLGIEVYKRRDFNGINVEHFYFGTEGENLAMPEINPHKRIKALSLSMAYHYSSKKKLKVRFRNKVNKNSRVLYATYGLGTQRTFYALFDSHRDDRGFNLPVELAPFLFSVIPVKSDDSEFAERIYQSIRDVAQLDDRTNLLFGERMAFSDYVGIPWKIICGDKTYMLKSRDESIKKSFNDAEELIEHLKR